jgi:hypothetical protein
MSDDDRLSAATVDGMLDAMMPYVEALAPDRRAGTCLLMASRLVEKAAYYAVRIDPGAPRVHLFDLAGHLDAASGHLGGGTT